MFIGIDGTGPSDDKAYMNRMKGGGGTGQSFVWRIYNQTPEHNRAYFRGPTNLGLDVSSIATKAVNQILAYMKTGDSKILLAGWSRGAAICVLVAQRLQALGYNGDVIDCIALFDAVDRSIQMSVDVIPNNVVKAYHAIRDPKVMSWTFPSAPISFGNTALKALRQNCLEKKYFYATHAGIGGVPFTGDEPGKYELEPTKSFGFIPDVKMVRKPTITKEQDIAGSKEVEHWMFPRIRQHGMIR